MSAIVCLTRGDSRGLEMLKCRNTSISKNLKNRSIPNIIFHEGNISSESQREVIEHTPELITKFIDVTLDNKAFQKESEKITIDPGTRHFGIGYRHMCHFWFVDFWKFVTQYSKILRIDDDCLVKSNLDQCFLLLDKYHIVAPQWVEDHYTVTRELNSLTEKFLKERPQLPQQINSPGGPYTNFFLLNLKKLRKNAKLQEFIKEIETSGNIYRYRWGDLPLWGKVVEHLISKDYFYLSPDIKYFHGSHNKYVNKNHVFEEYQQDRIMFNNKRIYR